MLRRTLRIAVLALLPAALAAQQPPATVTPKAPAETVQMTPLAEVQPDDGARRINVADAQTALAKGTAVLIDVRPKEAYEQSHAKGAKNIPLDQLANRLAELPKTKLIITYCT
jgi:3-mercaptopyruvate sulfurtransferase SseA